MNFITILIFKAIMNSILDKINSVIHIRLIALIRELICEKH